MMEAVVTEQERRGAPLIANAQQPRAATSTNQVHSL